MALAVACLTPGKFMIGMGRRKRLLISQQIRYGSKSREIFAALFQTFHVFRKSGRLNNFKHLGTFGSYPMGFIKFFYALKARKIFAHLGISHCTPSFPIRNFRIEGKLPLMLYLS